MTLTVGSTFTGVGGADLGLERAGFSVAWQCELDPWKRSVLAAHWPGIPIYEDIARLGVEGWIDNPAPVDLLIGGFPCQDLSIAGKRKGFDGERSVLAFEFLRLAESIRPRWLLLENVPGLLTSNRGRDFARLVDEMVDIGYGISWRVLDARYFAVPQRRRRAFICAHRADAEFDSGVASGRALRALWEGSGGDPTPGWPPRPDTTADAGSSSQSGRVYSPHGNAAETVTGTLTRMYSEQSGQDYAGGAGVISFYPTGGSHQGFARTDGVSPTLKSADGDPCAAIAFRKSKRAQTDQDDETWVEADETNTLNRFDTGDTRATQIITAFTQNQREEVRDLGEQSAAITGQGTHQTTYIKDPMMVRRLTPVECERLMGLDDGWTAPPGIKAPDSKRYAACGDAIVSWVAYWIGQRIRMIEEEGA